MGGDAVGRSLYSSQMIHFREKLQDVEGDTFRLQPAGLELVHVEDVIHHSEEHVGGFVDFMTAVPQLLDVSGMAVGYFYHAEDAIDRGADVVAHAAEEIRLRLAGDLGFAGALSELFLIAELFLSEFVDVLHGVEEGRDASIWMSLLHDEAAQVPDAIVIPVRHGEGVSFAKAVGEGGWLEEGFHGCLGRRMALIRPNEEKIDGKFLYYYFFSDGWRRVISENTVVGATVDRIPLIRFPDFPVSYPPMEEQKAIAAMLSDYDRLIENNQKQIKLLEEAAQRLYKEWFVDLRFPGYENTKIVDGVPEGWSRKSFSEVVTVMSGGTPKTDVKDYYAGTIPFYTPKDSDGSFFAFNTVNHISQLGLKNCNSQYYPAGTVIITARGTVGKTAILAVPMAMNQSCYALKCDSLHSPYYLFFALNKEVDRLRVMANGGVFNTIIVKTFDHISIFIPTSAVLELFNLTVSPIMEQIKTKMKQNTSLKEARDRLLPKLMNGELEV